MFKYIQFDANLGQLIVEAYKQRFSVDVPIEDNKFITGDALDAYVKACIPSHHFERADTLSLVSNGADISVLCSHPRETYVPSYVELREKNYPPLADFIDGMVKSDSEQMQSYIDRCLEVKRLYPKPIPELVSEEVLKSRREL
jgi:hypothetical protein